MPDPKKPKTNRKAKPQPQPKTVSVVYNGQGLGPTPVTLRPRKIKWTVGQPVDLSPAEFVALDRWFGGCFVVQTDKEPKS